MGLGHTFLLFWFSNMTALFSTVLTEFTFSVWISIHTASVTPYSLSVLLSILPGVIVTPWAGSLVDRLDKRKLTLVADAITATVVMLLSILLWMDTLRSWHLYLLNSILSICQVFQMTSFSASVTAMVPKHSLGRAMGMVQFGLAVPRLVAPWVAGLMIGIVGINAIAVLNLSALALAIGILLIINLPSTPTTSRDDMKASGKPGRADAFGDFTASLSYIACHPGLKWLTFYSTVQSFVIGLILTLVTPFVLSTYPAAMLGNVLSCSALGMVVGALVMIIGKTFPHPVLLVFAADLVMSVSIVAAGTCSALGGIYACGFAVMFCITVGGSYNQLIWQRKIVTSMQGRISAVRQTLSVGAAAAATILGGIAADAIFEPAMMPGGAVARYLSGMIGVGKGRGMAAMLLLAGIAYFGFVTLMATVSSLRNVHSTIPDAN